MVSEDEEDACAVVLLKEAEEVGPKRENVEGDGPLLNGGC